LGRMISRGRRTTTAASETANGVEKREKDRVALQVSDLLPLSGSEILNRILDCPDPKKAVQGLPAEDFYWILKKFSEEDALTLLELASERQWEYVLDLELWRKDRFDVQLASRWLATLNQADGVRLARWLMSEGESLAHYHFFRAVDVVVTSNKDESYDLPPGFFSLDGVFHIRARDPQHREAMENMIRTMGDTDFLRYQALLLGLSGVLPAELEEEMYRRRNVRLAEHGFLPFEESISVYAPLEPERIKVEKGLSLPDLSFDPEMRSLVPTAPFEQARSGNLLTEATAGIYDPWFLDRIRIEFAGLCNQIHSADGMEFHELDDLIGTCRKAARYVNLALERLCGRDLTAAAQVLQSHPLVTLFRVGFGLALKVKWEVERWYRGSWCQRQALGFSFWGDRWGAILAGLLSEKPKFHSGPGSEEEYKDFEWLSELSESMLVLRRLMVLDGLIEKLTEHESGEPFLHGPESTFHALLFNSWGRGVLGLPPGFSGISLKQVKRLFSILRGKGRRPPYAMEGFEEKFVAHFMSVARHADAEASLILKETLSLIWREFVEEYEDVALSEIDGRYIRFISIRAASKGTR
jgi:hypothetical protein